MQLAFLLTESEEWNKRNAPDEMESDSMTAEEQSAIINELASMGAVKME